MPTKRSNLVKPLIQVAFISLGVLCALSRIFDYWHHWGDVLVGLCLGTIVAFFIVSTIFSEINNLPWVTSTSFPASLFFTFAGAPQGFSFFPTKSNMSFCNNFEDVQQRFFTFRLSDHSGCSRFDGVLNVILLTMLTTARMDQLVQAKKKEAHSPTALFQFSTYEQLSQKEF